LEDQVASGSQIIAGAGFRSGVVRCDDRAEPDAAALVPAFKIASSLSSPDQGQADVAWHSAGEIEDDCRKVKPPRFQIPFPPQIDLSGFSAQGARPIGFSDIDRAATVGAQLARKTQEHELLFTAFGGFPRLLNQTSPSFTCNVVIDQLRYPRPPLFRGSPLRLLASLALFVLEIRDELAETRRVESNLSIPLIPRRHRWFVRAFGRVHPKAIEYGDDIIQKSFVDRRLGLVRFLTYDTLQVVTRYDPAHPTGPNHG
jgi:hypothetical protein